MSIAFDDRILDLQCLNSGGGPMRLTGRKRFGLVVCQEFRRSYLLDKDYNLALPL
jgi:hypothetical protein